MNNLPLVRLVNLGLRGLTLLAKFSLLFVLAYFLDPMDVALYGLVVATIAYSLFGLGFDFYSYSTRELLGSSSDQWARLLRDQSVFFGLVYALVLPLLLLIFVFELLPWAVAPWFFLLVILEHLAQELNRLLVAMSRQLLAGVVLFMRSGIWAFVVAFMFWQSEGVRGIELVFYAWAAGASLACLLGFSALYSLDRRCLKSTIDWQWIKKGVKVALPLLIATLAIRAVFTVDRYWVESVSGSEILAAYVLFAGVANTVVAFLDAGVFVFLYPKIVSAYKENDAVAFRGGMLDLLKQTIVVALLLCVSAAVLIHPILSLLQKEVYSQNVELLYFLLAGIFLFSISMVPHYGMYAMSKDRHIVAGHVLTLFVFLVAAAALGMVSPLYAVPLALCISFAFMAVYKTVAYLHLKSRLIWGGKQGI
ncbi:lipopolysaccharide biosynthesis protein [Halomonas sp. HK25]|uniref:lipopolysaccharide biosynthesis protein n=1 Tax=Halomonas sp. HK25 TaxID=3394321 RepID=UPI0039FC4D18